MREAPAPAPAGSEAAAIGRAPEATPRSRGGDGAAAARRAPATSAFRRLAREPLVHFVVFGAALLALHRAVAPPDPSDAIVVTTAMQRGFAEEHRRRHGREASPEELRALVERYVETEVMLREALALGLDRGDVIVRRRLVQKMELVQQDAAAREPPSEAELAAFLARHAERYRLARRISLRHVFVSSARHPNDAAAIADDLAERLAAGEDPAGLGDPFLRGRELRAQTPEALAGTFGPAFAEAVAVLPVDDAWHGPLASSFGLHLVQVRERTGGRPATVDEVRRELVRDFEEERRREAGRTALARLRARYDVRIEPAP